MLGEQAYVAAHCTLYNVHTIYVRFVEYDATVCGNLWI